MSNNDSQTLFDTVNIEPAGENGPADSSRLTGFTCARRRFLRPRADVAAPYPVEDQEFVSKVLQAVEFDVREYTVDRHATRIVVCADYARQLDDLRALKTRANHAEDARATLRQHPLRNRVLPEELVRYLDELPNSSLFTELVLLDWANPRDLKLRQRYQSDTFVSAAGTMNNGVVEFYCTENNQFLRINLFHEWTHCLEEAYPAVATAFDAALELEWREWVPDTYALRSYQEHWAVIGQELMHLDGQRFIAAVEQAPIRSAVWLQALKRTLAAVPEGRQSIYHLKWLQRVAVCERISKEANQKLAANANRIQSLQTFLSAEHD